MACVLAQAAAALPAVHVPRQAPSPPPVARTGGAGAAAPRLPRWNGRAEDGAAATAAAAAASAASARPPRRDPAVRQAAPVAAARRVRASAPAPARSSSGDGGGGGVASKRGAAAGAAAAASSEDDSGGGGGDDDDDDDDDGEAGDAPPHNWRDDPGVLASTEGQKLDEERWRKKVGIAPDARVFVMTGWYPNVREALFRRGWRQNPDRESEHYDMKWSLRSKEIEHDKLRPAQLANHFKRATSLTTKVGLMHSLRSLAWFEAADIDTFFPRCYDLSEPGDYECFVDEFRGVAAERVLVSTVFRVQVRRACVRLRACGLVFVACAGCLPLPVSACGLVPARRALACSVV